MRNEYVSFLFLLPELISTYARARVRFHSFLLLILASRPRRFFFPSLSLFLFLSFLLFFSYSEYSSFSLSISLDSNSRSNGISRRGGREKMKRKQEKGGRDRRRRKKQIYVPWMYSRCDGHPSEATAVGCWKVDRASYCRGHYSRSVVYLHN